MPNEKGNLFKRLINIARQILYLRRKTKLIFNEQQQRQKTHSDEWHQAHGFFTFRKLFWRHKKLCKNAGRI